ncbi:MAG: hypothetical protein SGI72_18655 [Planctomycetota bacterium]|nr:hypothetical protein [Planctomycetota bacterium]
MPEPIARYETRVSGLFHPRHTIVGADGKDVGVLSVSRNGRGTIVGAKYQPVQGEVLLIRRDPGILRSQFSCWTEGREWIGSSLRWSFFAREIALATGNKPYRLLPAAGLRRGWRMFAPKTGEMARIEPKGPFLGSRIHVFRRVDFELVLFAYFLGSQVYSESFWPGREVSDDQESVPTPSKA